MAGGASKANPTKIRKRVEVETSSLKRARDGSAFARCEECNKDVPVVLIDMHSCSFDAKIKMNLDAQVVEKLAEVRKKSVQKKSTESAKKSKKSKDPNAPKRPRTAFFVFLEDFRKVYKEANPDSKSVSTVAKEAGEKWKSMTDEEKKPYLDKAAELKAEYEKVMETYNNADDQDDEEATSDKEEVEEVQQVSDDE